MEVLWLIHNPTRMQRPYSCIITAGIYFPLRKSANEAEELTECITKCLDSILKERPSAAIVVTGDFNHLKSNLPNIQSTKGSSYPYLWLKYSGPTPHEYVQTLQ
jgi:hypothetical protein